MINNRVFFTEIDSSTVTITVDDRTAKKVKYSGNWFYLNKFNVTATGDSCMGFFGNSHFTEWSPLRRAIEYYRPQIGLWNEFIQNDDGMSVNIKTPFACKGLPLVCRVSRIEKAGLNAPRPFVMYTIELNGKKLDFFNVNELPSVYFELVNAIFNS
jgi:hypothetical protein